MELHQMIVSKEI